MSEKPKRNRRKDARPAEIIEAAMDIFIEHGFAAAKLDDVAKRAGVAKGTLYLYFNTKEDLFRAVVQQAVALHLQRIGQASRAFTGSLIDLIPVMLEAAAGKMIDSRVPALARLVIGESRLFPDLARIWHDNVLSQILTPLTGMIEQAQARNELRAGDAKAYAFSIAGPMVLALLFQEVFGDASPHTPNLSTLAKQHAETMVRGLVVGAGGL